MTNSRAERLTASTFADATSPLGFLLQPRFLLLFALLLQMAAMNFDISLISKAAYYARWPSLGLFCLIGFASWFQVTDRRLPIPIAIFGAFLIAVGLTTLWSFDPSYTGQRFVSLVLLYGSVSIGVWTMCGTIDQARRLTDVLWCIGTGLVLIGFVYRASAGEVGEGSGRFTGIYTRATGAGTYAALFLPLAIYQASYRFQGIWKLFAWGVVGLFLLQPVMASARAALLVSLLSLGFLGFAYHGMRALGGVFVALLLGLAVFAFDSRAVERIQEKADRVVRAESIGTLTGRWDRWVYGVEKFLERPAQGWGLGASRYLPGVDDPKRFGIARDATLVLHSDQVELLMDTGLLGMTLFTTFWITIWWTAARVLFQPASPARQLALAYVASVGYAFVDTFMHGAFMAAGGGTSAFSWTFLAGFAGISQLLARSQPVAQRISARPSPAPLAVAEEVSPAPVRPHAAPRPLRLPSLTSVLTTSAS